MTVALEPRRVGPRAHAGNGGAPARRAVVRWSWRLFRREWRQQVLVLTLLTVAVAATTAGLGVATSAARPAATVITLPGSDPQLDADVGALRAAYGPVTVVHHQRIAIPGSVATADLRSERSDGTNPTLRVVSGRYPAGVGEVAVTRHVAALFDLRVGGTWREEGRIFRVVGLVENPRDLEDQFALVAPGAADPPASVSVVLHSNPDRVSSSTVHLPSGTPLAVDIQSPTARAAATAAVLVFATLGLVLVGLVAVAGFTLMAQRRLRALGMLGSLGATDRNVRLVMLADGAAVGAAAAVIGVVVGLGVWIASAPRLEALVGHRIDRFALPWPGVAAAMVLAVVTALGAAWWPARSVSRVSVVSALSGRPPRPQPAHRFAAVGGVVLAVGLVLLGFAHGRRAGFVVGGTVATAVGLLALAPLAVRGLGVVGSRARIGVRLALRDLARYQARSGAALAAITLAVGLATVIAVSAAATAGTTDTTTGGNLAANQLVVYLSSNGGDGVVPQRSAAQLQTIRRRVQELASSLQTRDLVELDGAVSPDAPDVPGLDGTPIAALVRQTRRPGGFNVEQVATAYVATPELLARYRISVDRVGRNVDLLTSRRDLAGLMLGYEPRRTVVPTTQRVALPRYGSAPNTLITENALQRLGLQRVAAGWFVQTTRPLTAAQIDAARRLAAAAGLTIETRTTKHGLNQLGDDATAAGVLLALGILAMTVGLIRSETAHDLRTLSATGASRSTRRTITGATAGALAILGALLGAGGAYLALVAWHRSDLDSLTHVPWRNLAVVVIGLPLVAAIGGWLLAGREPPAIARQPLE